MAFMNSSVPTSVPRRQSLFFLSALLMFSLGAFGLFGHNSNSEWEFFHDEGVRHAGVVAPVGDIVLLPKYVSDLKFDAGRRGGGFYLNSPIAYTRVGSSGFTFTSRLIAFGSDWWNMVWIGFVVVPIAAGAVSRWWHFDQSLTTWRRVVVWVPALFGFIVIAAAAMVVIAGAIALFAGLARGSGDDDGDDGWGGDADSGGSGADADE